MAVIAITAESRDKLRKFLEDLIMSITSHLSKVATRADIRVDTDLYVESWHHSIVLAVQHYLTQGSWAGLLSIGSLADYTHKVVVLDGVAMIETYKISGNSLSKRLFARTGACSPFECVVYSKDDGDVILSENLAPGKYGAVL